MRRVLNFVLGSAWVALSICAMTGSVLAAELLMFEEPGCPWCRRWHAEVGVAYPKTKEGQRAPLRQVSLSSADGLGVTLVAPVRMFPTFVLVDRGREIGRITGYPGADFFWGMLTELMTKLDKGATCTRPTRSAALPTTMPARYLPSCGEHV